MTTSLDRARLLALLLVPVALACSDGSPPPHPDDRAPGSDLGVSTQAIQNGVVDSAGLARSVVFLRSPGATGVVIGRRLVLTAAHLEPNATSHCAVPSALSPIIPFADDGITALNSAATSQVGGVTGEKGGHYHPLSFLPLAPDPNNPSGQACPPSSDPCSHVFCGGVCNGQSAHVLALNSRHDIALIETEQEFPPEIVPLPILLHPNVVGSAKMLANVRKVPLSRINDFAATKPKVTIAGYGLGNTFLSNDPGVGIVRSRDLGITTLLATTLGPLFPDVFTGCGTHEQRPNDLVLRSAPSGIDITQARDRAKVSIAPGHTAMDDNVKLTPGPDGTNVESWVAPGDSGGPLLLGAGFGVPGAPGTPGLASTPLPAAWVTEGLVAPGEAVVAGVLSRTFGITADDSVFPPQMLHTATFEPNNTAFLKPFLTDTDGDGYPDFQDSCPLDPEQRDFDGDGLVGKCDPFPCTPPAQEDQDQDGLLDVCDPTLVAPGTTDSSFCLSHCASNPAADACPNLKLNGYNGNRRAEDAQRGVPMADACDPVPYPNPIVSASKKTLLDSEQKIVNVANGIDAIVTVNTYLTASDAVRLASVGSHYSPAKATLGSANAGKEEAVQVAQTNVRVCLSAAIDCNAREATDDSLLTTAGSADQEQFDHFWHRITLVESATPGAPFQQAQLYGQGQGPTRFWNWQADYQRWTTTWGTLLLPPLTTPSQPGDGEVAFWMNSSTKTGMDLADPLAAVTGFHPSLDNPDQPAVKLSNGYTSALVLDTLKTTKAQGYVTTYPLLPPITVYPCLSCKVNPPFLDQIFDPALGLVRDLSQYARGQAQMLARWNSVPALRGVMLDDGSLQDVEDQFGPGLRDSLATDARWTSQVEPSAAMGRGSFLPTAVGLAPDGSRLAERITLRGGQLLGQRDLTPRTNPGGGAAPVAKLALPTTDEAAPPPREQFTSVYSRSTGRVFVLGGKDPVTKQPRRDLWWTFVDDDTNTWLQVPTSFQPENVVAATFSTRDGQLWVLDRRTVAGKPTMRLTRVKPQTGEAQTLGEWPVAGWFDQHWLSLDRDGHVLLSASSAKPDKHLIVRLTAGVQVQVDGVSGGNGRLMFAPVSDEEGYWLVTAKNKKAPERIRLATLALKGAGWAQLGGCW